MSGDIMSEYELIHYGVKGMRWGIRRSKAQLGNAVTKRNKKIKRLTDNASDYDALAKKYNEKSVRVQSRNNKYEKRLVEATAQKAKYDLKLQKATAKGKADKVAKYAGKTAKYQMKIDKANKKIKYNKWAIKSEEAKAAATKARSKIEKNERLVNMYNSTISALDAGTVKQGRVFMQYVLER